MADVDEDAIPPISTAADNDDLEDETLDFRFLSQLTSQTRSSQTNLPKRGNKDFEPNPTRSQASSLDAARQAMHHALSSVRVHREGSSHVTGQYLSDEEDWRFDEDVGGAVGVRHGRCVVVPRFRSTHAKVMGRSDERNWTWLLPEEALFLLERGNLDIRWPDVEDEKDDDGGDDDTIPNAEHQEVEIITDAEDAQSTDSTANVGFKLGSLPMSLQGAYASFIGKDGLTLERYSVYAGLKRAGYIVQRAPTWHDIDPPRVNGYGDHAVPPPPISLPFSNTAASNQTTTSVVSPERAISTIASLVQRLVAYLFRPERGLSNPSHGPLVAPGLYRSYADIFRSLSLVPLHTTSTPLPSSSPPQPQSPYRIHLHVWKPSSSSSFKKSSPSPPDYRISVIDARLHPSIPTLAQLAPLLDSQPEDALTKTPNQRLETRLKHGKRNVLLAVVDVGVVSYLRLSDAVFGAENLWEEKGRGGAKSGKGAGSGRGRHGPRKPGQTRTPA
jgi:tRNA-splicing endonuclease subunit Sen54